MDQTDWKTAADALERSLMPVLVNWLRTVPMTEVEKIAGPAFAALPPERKAATVTVLCTKLARERRELTQSMGVARR